MKAFEKIFLYSVLAGLVFYMFLLDGKVENKFVMQGEGIKTKSISIVNDVGKEVISLGVNEEDGEIKVYNKYGDFVFFISTDKDGDGLMSIANKYGPVVVVGNYKDGGGIISICNKDNALAVDMLADEDNGKLVFYNKSGNTVIGMRVVEGGGRVDIVNKDGTPATT